MCEIEGYEGKDWDEICYMVYAAITGEVFTGEAHEIHRKLEEVLASKLGVKNVMVYNGDDELISSINSEYHFDPDDIILTDGCIFTGIQEIEVVQDKVTEQAIECSTVIRGATYLIIHRPKFGSDDIEVRVDLPYVVKSKANIEKAIEKLKNTKQDIKYAQDWVHVESWLNNPQPVIGGLLYYEIKGKTR